MTGWRKALAGIQLFLWPGFPMETFGNDKRISFVVVYRFNPEGT
jgi:hypothetical protein